MTRTEQKKDKNMQLDLVKTLRGALALNIACMATAVVAQSTVPQVGDVLREVPAKPQVERPKAPLPQVGAELAPPMQSLPDGGARVQVSSFRIEGSREVGAAELEALANRQAGKAMTLAELEAVATELTRYYRTRGYFVARVYIPAQEVMNDVIVLRAVEGNYGRFILENRSLVRDSIVQAMLDDVKKYDIVSLDTLERAMLIINDTPGVQVVRADVMPGEAVGTSDFAVGTVAIPEHQGYMLLDNYGSKATGRERLSVNWDWNSPTGSGDRLSITGLSSLNGDLLNGRAGYSTVLSASGLRGEAALSRTNYTLGSRFAALDAEGVATGFDLGVSYPIRRIRAQTIAFSAGYAMRNLKDEVKAFDTETRKRSQVLSAGFSLRDEAYLWGLDGLTEADIRLGHGDLNIRDALSLEFDQSPLGPDTDGRFTKVNLSLSRLSLLPDSFRLRTSLRYQSSFGGKNLDGSERLGISGVGSVSAYPYSEASGTDASLLSVELSRPFAGNEQLQHEWSLFAQAGQARAVKSESYQKLSGFGVGWSGRYGQGLLLRAQVARQLSGESVSEPGDKTRIWLQAGYIF